MTVVKSDSNLEDNLLSPLINNGKENVSKKDNQGVNLADSIQENFPLGDLSAYMLGTLYPTATTTTSTLPFGAANSSLTNTSSMQQNDLQTLAAVQLQLQILQQQQQQQQQQQILQMASLLSSNTTSLSSTASTSATTNTGLTTPENQLNSLTAIASGIPGAEGMNDFQIVYFQMLQYYYQLQMLKTKNPSAITSLNNQLLANYSPALLQQQLLSIYTLQQQQQQQQLLKSLDLSHYTSLMNSFTPEQLALFGLNPLNTSSATSSTATTSISSTSSSTPSTTSKSTTQKNSKSNNASTNTSNKTSSSKNTKTTTTNEKVHILPNLHDGLLLGEDKIKNLMLDPLLQASNLLYQYPYSFPLIPILPQHSHEMLLPSPIKKIQHSSTDGPILKCPEPNCNKVFTRPYNLKSHQLSHSGVRPFKCKTCQTSFVRKHDLKRHERLHTGVKPYVCSVCKRGFYRSDALSRHEHSGTCGMNALVNRTRSSSSAIRNHKNSIVNSIAKTTLTSTPSTVSSSSSHTTSNSPSNSSLTTSTSTTTSTTVSKAPKSIAAKILPSTANLTNTKSLLDTLTPSLFIGNGLHNTKSTLTTTASLLPSLTASPDTLLNSQLSSLVNINSESLLSSKLNSFENLLPTTLSSLAANSSLLVSSLPNLTSTNSLLPTTLSTTTSLSAETSLATSSTAPTTEMDVSSILTSVTNPSLADLTNNVSTSTSNGLPSTAELFPILSASDASLAESVLAIQQNVNATPKK